MGAYKILNEQNLLEQYGEHTDILRSIIEVFEENYKPMLEKINTAIVKKDLKEIESSSHAFKGAVSNFYVEEIRLLAYQLEDIGMKGNLNGHNIEATYKELSEKTSELLHDISELKKKLAA